MRSSRNPGPGVRSWRDNKARPLSAAARLARELTVAEHLPVGAAAVGDAERWHTETILKTVAVYGTRDGRRERVPAKADLRLDPESRSLSSEGTVWSDLAVEREDFMRYVAWLRSVW